MKITCTEQQKNKLSEIIWELDDEHDCKLLCETHDCVSISCKECIEKNIEWDIVKTLDAETCISALRFCANNPDCEGCPIWDGTEINGFASSCMLKIADVLEKGNTNED